MTVPADSGEAGNADDDTSARPNHNVKGTHIMATSDCITTDHSGPGTRPKLSRDLALHWLDALDEQFNNVVCIVLGAIAYQDTRADDYKDEVTCSLLRIIQEQANDSVKFGNELRKMLATLPKEEKHG